MLSRMTGAGAAGHGSPWSSSEDAQGMCPDDALVTVDERRREKEFGILDRLTSFGIQAQYPSQIDRAADVANCSVTTYTFDAARGKHGKLVLQQFNVVDHLHDAGEPVTRGPDAISPPA